jgi:peroxiredoxin-like protein
MAIDHVYEVDVNWIKDRVGVLYSPELNDELNVVTPPQFPHGVDKIWSPEHLFTAAVNSCLMTTFLAIAENSQLSFVRFTSKAYGRLEMVENKYTMSEILLKPNLVVHSLQDVQKAMKILHKAESACLISNSIKSKIIFEPVVTTDKN